VELLHLKPKIKITVKSAVYGVAITTKNYNKNNLAPPYTADFTQLFLF
jgi:hypothetical protein